MTVCLICSRLNSTSEKIIEREAEMSFDGAKIYDTMLGRCQSHPSCFGASAQHKRSFQAIQKHICEQMLGR